MADLVRSVCDLLLVLFLPPLLCPISLLTLLPPASLPILLPVLCTYTLQYRLLPSSPTCPHLLTSAISAPIDYALWAPTLPHPSLPDFTVLHTLWPELAAAHWNIVSGKADEWGVMPVHFYATSLVKMLFGAFPLLVLGIVWATLLLVTGTDGGVWHNKALQRCVGEVSRTLGPGVVSLIAVLSTVGHKASVPGC